MKKALIAILFLSVAVAYGQPEIQEGSTVNAADYSRDLAPGGILVVFGSELAPEYIPAASIPLPVSLGGTSVELVDGGMATPLPLYYVIPTQVAAQAPYEVTPGKAYGIRVRTAAGVSVEDAVTFSEAAPKYFAINHEGFGRVVGADMEGEFLLRSNPMMPGDWYVLYANSMGQTDSPAVTGDGAGDGSVRPLNTITGDVKVVINEREALVDWAGLTPGLVGLYQINIQSPYNEDVGDVGAWLSLGEVQSQAEMTLPVEPNGFYYVYSGGKFPNGQTRNGVPGPNSAIAFRHEDPPVWGEEGFLRWTLNTTMQPYHDAASGLALTLMNGDVIVYDNNGIETGEFGNYYDNSSGAESDTAKAGLWEWYSNVNNDYAIFASYFKLEEETTFDRIIGYFDYNGRAELRFDPDNIYNTYRMNIWSMGGDGRPATDEVVGDVFTSSATPGSFEYSQTAAARVFSTGARDEIYRMVYTLNEPVTLEAGEYWFAHDLMVPKPLENPNPEPAIESKTGPLVRKSANGRAYKPDPGPPAGPEQ